MAIVNEISFFAVFVIGIENSSWFSCVLYRLTLQKVFIIYKNFWWSCQELLHNHIFCKKGYFVFVFFSPIRILFISFSCPIGLAKTSNYCITMERMNILHFIPDLSVMFLMFSAFNMM